MKGNPTSIPSKATNDEDAPLTPPTHFDNVSDLMGQQLRIRVKRARRLRQLKRVKARRNAAKKK